MRVTHRLLNPHHVLLARAGHMLIDQDLVAIWIRQCEAGGPAPAAAQDTHEQAHGERVTVSRRSRWVEVARFRVEIDRSRNRRI